MNVAVCVKSTLCGDGRVTNFGLSTNRIHDVKVKYVVNG